MGISHGYETSTSGLRILGVEECSQLYHEGVPSSRQHVGNLSGFPTLILSRDARNHLAINKGQETRELWMEALHLGTGQPFGNIPTG